MLNQNIVESLNKLNLAEILQQKQNDPPSAIKSEHPRKNTLSAKLDKLLTSERQITERLKSFDLKYHQYETEKVIRTSPPHFAGQNKKIKIERSPLMSEVKTQRKISQLEPSFSIQKPISTDRHHASGVKAKTNDFYNVRRIEYLN